MKFISCIIVLHTWLTCAATTSCPMTTCVNQTRTACTAIKALKPCRGTLVGSGLRVSHLRLHSGDQALQLRRRFGRIRAPRLRLLQLAPRLAAMPRLRSACGQPVATCRHAMLHEIAHLIPGAHAMRGPEPRARTWSVSCCAANRRWSAAARCCASCWLSAAVRPSSVSVVRFRPCASRSICGTAGALSHAI